MANLQNLGASWLADPSSFLRQFVANQMGYGQIIVTAFPTGNLQPISAISGDVPRNLTNVIATLMNTSFTAVLELWLLPTSVTLDNVIGLDALLLGFDLSGAPASTLQAADSSATALTTAVQAGNPAPRSPLSSVHPRSSPTAMRPFPTRWTHRTWQRQ